MKVRLDTPEPQPVQTLALTDGAGVQVVRYTKDGKPVASNLTLHYGPVLGWHLRYPCGRLGYVLAELP